MCSWVWSLYYDDLLLIKLVPLVHRCGLYLAHCLECLWAQTVSAWSWCSVCFLLCLGSFLSFGLVPVLFFSAPFSPWLSVDSPDLHLLLISLLWSWFQVVWAVTLITFLQSSIFFSLLLVLNMWTSIHEIVQVIYMWLSKK